MALLVNPPTDERITAVPLLEDCWGILTASGSDLARSPQPSFELLDGADVVAWTEGWEVQREVERAWRRRGIRPHVVSRTDDVTVLHRLVAAGHGHAVFSRLGAGIADDPGLTWLEPEDPLLARAVTLCYPAGRRLAPAVRTLAEAIRAVARSQNSSG